MRNSLKRIVVLFIVALGFSVVAQEDSIIVTGTVQDLSTGQPIEGAMLLFFCTNTYVTSPDNIGIYELDTAFTGADGTFSITMAPTSSAFLGIVTRKPGYEDGFKFQGVSTTNDLGIIELVKKEIEGILIRQNIPLLKNRPNTMRICSLDGKLLYDGPVASIKNTALNRSGVAMVTLMRNNAIIDRKQIFLTR